MHSEGNGGSYVGGSEGRPLPPVDLNARSSGHAAQTYTCPTCGWKARKKAFHLCSPPEPEAPTTRRATVSVTPLTDDEVTRKFTPATTPPVVEVETAHPADSEEPKPRVRARVTAGKPGPGVLISLSGPVSTVQVAALVSDLLAALNGAPQTAAPAKRKGKPFAGAASNRGAGGGIGGSAGKLKGHDQAIIERYKAGEHPRQIAETYECTPEAIRYLLKRNGITLRSSGEAHRGMKHLGARALTAEQEQQAVRLYVDEARTIAQIAEQLGVGDTTVRMALKRNDVQMRPSGRRPRGGA